MNVLWGSFNIAVGYLLIFRVGIFDPRSTGDILAAASGAVEVNGVRLEERDGAAILGETSLTVRAISDAEVVLVDTR